MGPVFDASTEQMHCGSFGSKTVTVPSPIPTATTPSGNVSVPVTEYVVVTAGDTVIVAVVSFVSAHK